MTQADNDITLATIMKHMLAMEQRLVTKIEDVRTELKNDIGRVEGNLSRVERKVDVALVQIGNIDERLDDIEVVQVPKLKKAVGMR